MQILIFLSLFSVSWSQLAVTTYAFIANEKEIRVSVSDKPLCPHIKIEIPCYLYESVLSGSCNFDSCRNLAKVPSFGLSS